MASNNQAVLNYRNMLMQNKNPSSGGGTVSIQPTSIRPISLSGNASSTSTPQPAQQDNTALINSLKQQIIGAKYGVLNPNLTQAQKNQFYDQSNAARTQLQGMGINTENSYLKSGLSYQDAMMGFMGEQFKQQSDQYFNEQSAMIDSAMNTKITALQKAYDDALAQGNISKQQAQADFEASKNQIMQDAYVQKQATLLGASDRGISNSQQLVGLQQNDNARQNTMVNQNTNTRDQRIADIQQRLDSIKMQNELDIASAQSEGAYSKAQAKAQAGQMYNGNMLNLESSLFNNNMQNANQLNQMSVSHQYDQQNMATQQQYNQSNMKLGLQIDLSKMRTQQGYDLQKMDKQQSYDLSKMAKQFGYDMSKMSTEQRNALSRISAQSKAQMQAQNDNYVIQRNRVMASYTPGTPEYKIRMAQVNDANDQAMKQYASKAMYDSMAAILKPGTPAFKKFMKDPNYVLNNYAMFTDTSPTGYTELKAR